VLQGRAFFESDNFIQQRDRLWFVINYFPHPPPFLFLVLSEEAEEEMDSENELSPSLLVCCPNLHIYYSNRAFCHIKLENYGSAILDAGRAIKVNPGFSKAYYRRGCANLLLQKYKLALRGDQRSRLKKTNIFFFCFNFFLV
jgi:hypothetical protein